MRTASDACPAPSRPRVRPATCRTAHSRSATAAVTVGPTVPQHRLRGVNVQAVTGSAECWWMSPTLGGKAIERFECCSLSVPCMQRPVRPSASSFTPDPHPDRCLPDSVLPPVDDRGRVPRQLHPAARADDERGVQVHARHQLRRTRKTADPPAAPLIGAAVPRRDDRARLLHRRVPQAARGQLGLRRPAVVPGMFTGFTGYSLPDDLLSAPACTSWRARSCRSRSSGRTGTSCVPPLRGRTQDGEIAFVLRQFNRSFVFQGQSDIPATADPKFEIDAL